jgi:hypothetical protein
MFNLAAFGRMSLGAPAVHRAVGTLRLLSGNGLLASATVVGRRQQLSGFQGEMKQLAPMPGLGGLFGKLSAQHQDHVLRWLASVCVERSLFSFKKQCSVAMLCCS